MVAKYNQWREKLQMWGDDEPTIHELHEDDGNLTLCGLTVRRGDYGRSGHQKDYGWRPADSYAAVSCKRCLRVARWPS
jgi:hypothetical protein